MALKLQSLLDLLYLDHILDTFGHFIDESPHDKTNKIACAPSEDSDQPEHPPQSDQSRHHPHEESFGP